MVCRAKTKERKVRRALEDHELMRKGLAGGNVVL